MSNRGTGGSEGDFFVLAEALRAFKAGPLSDDPSDRALARAAEVSPTTIGQWLQGKRFPQDIGKILVVVRMVQEAAAARGIASPCSGSAMLLDEGRWRAAHQAEAQRRAGVVSGAVQRAQAIPVLTDPAAGVRVSECDPRPLGVHAAISVAGVSDDTPPEYVPRDTDAAEFGVRARVTAAAKRGGFVLLVGGSSVGKTRCAVEAVRAILPDWRLVHPAGPAEVVALAAAPSSRIVVWLDELQRYLDGEHGLTGAAVRDLLNPSRPVVIIGTLWPDRYTAYTTVPTPGTPDPHVRQRQVLDLAAVIRIAPEFTPAEQSRARTAATRDARLRAALGAAGYGVTQTLAGAPQLVARWEDAQTASPYARAVLTAALDAARLGARAPLSPDFLRAAAPGYCTSQQQAEAPDNWFEQALAYATTKLHGAVAALRPAGIGMGRVAGYIPADYLIQHTNRERRYARLPVSTWDAILTHIHDPADTARLAASARNRLLFGYAVPLYRHASETGDTAAVHGLADLLAERGDLGMLRGHADGGDPVAAMRLADLLVQRGDLDELRARADGGDLGASWRLDELLAERDDLDELRARADGGDMFAVQRLARRGDLNELPDRANTDDGPAAPSQLAECGDLDELRGRADAGDENAAVLLALMLARRGDLDALRARADAEDLHATVQLVELLAERGDLHELRARADADADADADAGDLIASRWLARLLAARRLAELLAEHDDLDELRARADAGDLFAAMRLAELLAERDDLDELRARADAGDRAAAVRLAELLEMRGDLGELRARTDAGDVGAGRRLADLLMKQGRSEEAEQLRRLGLNPDGSIGCV